MFEIVPFKREHLEPLMLEKINAYLPEWVRKGHAAEMEKTNAVTIFVDGEIMACGGITEIWNGRGNLWGIFSEASKRYPIAAFRAMKKYVDSSQVRRIEVAVPCGLEVGHKRVRLLGFKLECVAEKYLPNGLDCTLYARIKDGG